MCAGTRLEGAGHKCASSRGGRCVNLRGLGWYLALCSFRGLGRLPVQILGSGGARGGWGAGSRWLGIGIPMGKAAEDCGPGHHSCQLLTIVVNSCMADTVACLSFAGLEWDKLNRSFV